LWGHSFCLLGGCHLDCDANARTSSGTHQLPA
jgi:hypothetical protein